MHVLLTINALDQDLELGVAFDAELKNNGWESASEVPYTYIKKLRENSNELEVKKIVKSEIDSAVIEAEWNEVDYVYLISPSKPNFAKSS